MCIGYTDYMIAKVRVTKTYEFDVYYHGNQFDGPEEVVETLNADPKAIPKMNQGCGIPSKRIDHAHISAWGGTENISYNIEYVEGSIRPGSKRK